MKKAIYSFFKTLFALCFLLLGQWSWGQVNMTITGSYSQDFNTLINTGISSTWIDNSILSNWYSQRSGNGTTIVPGTGSSNTGNLYSFGIASGNVERALGTYGSSNASAGNFAHGLLLKNTSGSTITNITVTYTGEQWRVENVPAQTVSFFYKISTSPITSLSPNSNSTWISVNTLDFESPVINQPAGAIDGNLAVNKVVKTNVPIPDLSIANGDYIMLKWDDPNHLGNDHGLAIDDVTISWTVANSTPYTLTYDGNSNTGGVAPVSETHNSGTAVTLATNSSSLVKTTGGGYTFNGWNSLSNGTGTHYNAGATNYIMPGADTTLYAEWSYQINYHGNGHTGGTAPSTQTGIYSSNTTVAGAGSLVRTGFIFSGWKTAADGSGTAYSAASAYPGVSGGNVTLYAQWSPATYTVTYNGNTSTGGTVPVDGSNPYNHNTTVTVLGNTGNLVKTCAIFNGWNTAANGLGTAYLPGATFSITDNATLYAQWTSTLKTISFNNNGGAGSMTAQSACVATAITNNTFTRTGYTFAGWNTLADGTGTAYTNGANYDFLEDITLFARWTPNSNTITFNGNGANGGSTASQTIATGAMATLNLNGFTRTGYNFAGWANTSGGAVAYPDGANYTMGTGDVTLYAKWTANNYQVIFDKNDAAATGTMANQTIAYQASANLSSNAYSKAGFVFTGWNTAANGTGTAYANGASYTMITTANVTLFAQWGLAPVPKTYTLVTDVSQLEAGKKYLIVNSGNATSNARAVGSQNDNNRAQSDQLTIVNSGGNMTITTLVADSNSSTAPFEFFLGGSSGAWTFQDVVNTGLLYPVSGENYLRNATGGTNNYNWTVSIAGTSAATIATMIDNRTIRYNPNNPNPGLFSAYTTGQQDVYLYKEGIPAPVAPYYRSQATGTWSDVSTWQSSTDNITWANAAAVPTQAATSILIRNGHTVSIAGSGVSMKGVTIESGGVLEHAAQADWTLGGTGIQLMVNSGGVLLVNFPGPSPAGVKINGSGEALVKTGGKVQVGPVIEDGSLAGDLYLRTNSKFTYEHDAIFEWSNGNRVLGTAGTDVNFFRTNNPTDLPVLRISVKPGFPYGSSSNNIFNAILEVNAELSFQGNGVKTFKGGIRGTGTVYQPVGTLEFPSTPGITPILGGSVTINTISSGIRLMNGATVPVGAHVTIKSVSPNDAINKQAGSLLVNGTLDLSEMRVVNTSGDVTVNGTLRTAHSGGLYGTGSAIPSGSLVINTGSTVDYNRNGDQIISNPSLSGITGSSTVTEGAGTNTAYYHVLFSGSGTKSGNSYTRVHQNGSVRITGTPVVDFSGSNLGLNAGNTTDFIMEGGRLILGSGGTQPNMNGQYSLSGGVIEFTGSSAVQIRTGVSPKQYLNIEVSGTNVSAGTTDDSGLTFQSGGTFTVKKGGVFKVPNTAGFTGTAASAIKNSAVLSAINLETGSTVEYKRAGDQVITAQVNVGQGAEGNYANLKISGSGIKSPDTNLTVKENIVVVSGELRIKSTTDNLTNTDNHLPNVLWAHQGIQNTGGTVTLGNNAQLMQDATGVTNTGNVVVERDTRIPASGTAQYVYWSSPVVPSSAASGTFFKTIFPGHTTQPLYYNETNDYFYNSTGAYMQGRGLAVKNPVTSGSPASLTAKLTGTPFNGNASFTMTMNGRGFNLVGNPYPSNISLQELYTLNGGDPAVETEDGKIASTFHLWDNSFNADNTQEGSGYGGASYATYNAKGSGTGNPANSSSKDPDGGIASIAQGFMVKAIKPTDKTLIFNNTVREPMKSIFFKGENPDAGKFWIRMTTPRNQFSTTAITYSKGATDSFDSFDSRINSNSSDLIYSLADDQKLAIQGRAFEFSTSDIVPLGSKSYEAGVHTIHLWKRQGIFDGQQQIYLKDKQTGTVTNLSKGSYSFTASAGETTGRFEIVYKDSSVLATDSEAVNGFSAYLNGTNFVARSDRKILLNAQLYDSGGRLLADAPGKNQTQILFRADHLAHGIYVIKAQMKDGNTVTKKVRK